MPKRPIRRRRDDEQPTGTPPPAKPAPTYSEDGPARGYRAPPRAQAATSAPSGVEGASERLSELEAFAGMAELDMEALLGAAPRSTRLPEPGTRIKGTITRRAKGGWHVDLQSRVEGYLPGGDEHAPGDVIEAFVVAADDLGIELSMKLTGQAAAAFLEEAHEGGIPVEGKVTSRNGGGYEVRVGPVRAFCPVSQMSRVPLPDPDEVIGRELLFKVLEVGEKVVLSRRALEEEALEANRDAVLAGLTPGVEVRAVASRVLPWGAFLDHEGVELFLPKNAWSWDEVDDLSTRLARGTWLTVRIVDLAGDRDRIVVTARDPDADPYRHLAARFAVGQTVTGTVSGHAPFGAFIDLGDGLRGLLPARMVAPTPDGLPALDSAVTLVIASLDADRRRITLAPEGFDPAAAPADLLGEEVSGTAVDVRHNGVVVTLEDGRQAWLPAREVPLDPGQMLAHRFRAGHVVTARVKEAPERGRIVLTQREAEDDASSWRDHVGAQRGGMGTLGDLFKRR